MSSEDEAFLEAALDDRAKSVRTAASGLLARLPGSALVVRACARGLPLLAMERGLLRRKLTVALPEPPGKPEERDGIDPKAPPAGLHQVGPRQVQLAQMIAQVPMSHWTGHLGLDAASLVEQFQAHEYANALCAGLAMAVSRQARPEELRALVALADRPATRELYRHWIEPALPSLPDFGDFVAGRMQANNTLDTALLAALPAPWPHPVTEAVLRWARHEDRAVELRADYSHYEFTGLLRLAALRAAPQAEFLLGWKALDRDTASTSQRRAAEAVDEFLSTVQARIDFLSSLEKP